MNQITQSDLEKLIRMFSQLAEESNESLQTTEGSYLARYYCGVQDTALTIVEVLKMAFSVGIPNELPLIDKK